MSNTFDYLVAPKASFDATADAIRAKTGSQASITWGQNGFADEISKIDVLELRATNATYAYENNRIVSLKTSRLIDDWSNLSSLSLPSCLEISKAFSIGNNNNTNLVVHLPNLVNITGGQCFQSLKCTAIVLPSVRSIPNYGFHSSTIPIFDLGTQCTSIGGSYSLNGTETVIILRSPTICSLSNTNSLPSAVYGSSGTGGTIYIPKVLYDHLGDGTANDYQSATNWSTLHGYGHITWAKIEGSQYENYYADGTSITQGNGVNLLQNSEHLDPSEDPYTHSNTFTGSAGKFDGEQKYYCSGSCYIQVDLPDLIEGSFYTLSFDLRRDDTGRKVWAEIGGTGVELGTCVSGEWVRFSYTFCANPYIDAIKIHVYSVTPGASTGYEAAFRKFKLELGNNATAWTGGTS